MYSFSPARLPISSSSTSSTRVMVRTVGDIDSASILRWLKAAVAARR